MASRVQWEPAPDLHRRLGEIARALGFDHVDISRVHAVRASGSRANAWARIWGLPTLWQQALGVEPSYVIEAIEPDFSSLPVEHQDRVLIHELLHIPKTFSGAVRPERSPYLRINPRTVERYYRECVRRLGR